jgi:hypothetical protein
VSIGALGVSRGVHNIAFSVSPDVVNYFHLTPLFLYYKKTHITTSRSLKLLLEYIS